MTTTNKPEGSSKVPLTLENIGRCWCPDCPVQKESSCIHDLKVTLPVTLDESPLKTDKVPGIYCSTGTATCTDLDQTKNCLCPTCGIFGTYGLAKGKPVGYYCRDGAAM